jgi:hypothetical protein
MYVWKLAKQMDMGRQRLRVAIGGTFWFDVFYFLFFFIFCSRDGTKGSINLPRPRGLSNIT